MPTSMGKMRALLAELIELLGKDYELNVIDSSNNTQLTYVRVPKTSSNRSFHNSKEWLDVAIKVAGTKHGGTFEAAYRISNHLLCYYQDSVMAACETQKLPVSKPMTATQFSSMMNAARVRNKEFVKKRGGSLNGKDIRKVMTNACYVFDTFAAIFKGGKRPNCSLSDTHIDALCSMYVKAAVKGSKDLRCTFTPKVHLMLNHVAYGDAAKKAARCRAV